MGRLRRPGTPGRRPVAALATALAALTASNCTCDDGGGVVSGKSKIFANPTRIDLGRVFVGGSAEDTFQLTVSGVVPVTFSARFDGGETAGLRAGPAAGRILAGGSLTMTVQLIPRTPGPRYTTIVFDHDAEETPDPVRVEVVAQVVDVPDCEDGNGCTEDTFDIETGQCKHEAVRVPCDDFNACTQNDTCVEGVCLGESVSCDDGSVCTDDVCDPQQGCLHLDTITCDDGNGCTRDLCDGTTGCRHEVLEDGTPCQDFELCTTGDICLLGECRGVAVDDGQECDDGDPCSHDDQCIEGRCRDPGYRRAQVGELKYHTPVGPLAPGAARNPIVDRDSTTFMGTEDGVVAVDQCGEVRWHNRQIGTPRFEAAASLPGLLSVPVGSTIVDVETVTGTITRRLELADVFPAVETASTATVTVEVLDVAVRGSGGLVVSLFQEVSDPASQHGLLIEVDPGHNIASLFRDLGTRHARRVAIDQDEAVVTLISDGVPTAVSTQQQVIRFGLEGLPETTWSTSRVGAVESDLAIGQAGEVLWTAGLYSISRHGEVDVLLAPANDPAVIETGPPVLTSARIYVVVRREDAPSAGPGAPGGTFHLLALTSSTGATVFDRVLPARAVRMSPAVDREGNVFVLLEDGEARGYAPDGSALFAVSLPVSSEALAAVTVTLSPDAVLVAAIEDAIFGVQSVAPLDFSAWPRHRRDNLSTGHR
ncbi:MAG: hypothetical protein H6730_07425 [Deltaproteobacteria bacterium]|nr:hypothetical protein [Deltaproteobacteria bacterium]